MDFKFKNVYDINDLLTIMEILRSDEGCPWDKVQTHHTIRNNFIEETYEVIEAIDNDNPVMLQEELGDVLLQVVFHSQMEKEKKTFDFSNVVNDICKKLIERHPHIFSDIEVHSVDEVLSNWADIKQKQKGQETKAETLCSVPKQLPALMRSQKIQSRAKKGNHNFGYSDIEKVLADLKSEISELEDALKNNDSENIVHEAGDVLFSCTNVLSFLKLDAEETLTKATNRFIDRFTLTEELSIENGTDFSSADADKLDVFWNEAKKLLNSRGKTPHEYIKNNRRSNND